MPEGDTIFRAARNIGRALSGRRITRFESIFPHLNRVHEDDPIEGRTVQSVSPRGKHLLIRFSGNLTLRTHMRMKGSWHIYRHEEPWKRSRRNARIILETDELVVVGFSIPVAELFRSDHESKNRDLRRLGPDLLDPDFDITEASERLRARSSSIAADVLLDQTVVSGIGNVYKSEVLFICGINPKRTVNSLDDSQVSSLIETARQLMRRNVDPQLPPTGRRTTRRLDPSAKLWVYGRGSSPCRKCSSPVRRDLVGRDARVTYWCPACQPAVG
ncbi:MAG: DNA-formamidopyrimidine glycosylase family protein [Thermoanaerobaculia bacterium]|nr:DNA-formamidopyrimidine glycosylase family protein [Thermoanaerobaculia bacterium]